MKMSYGFSKGVNPLVLSILVLIGIDQGTKLYASKAFIEPFEITEFFRFIFVENTGVAFSMPVPRQLLLIVTALILIFGTRYFFQLKDKNKFQTIGGILFLAGAAGNFIDRLINGAVIDFISFWSFPIFNLADVFISAGVVCLFLEEILRKKE